MAPRRKPCPAHALVRRLATTWHATNTPVLRDNELHYTPMAGGAPWRVPVDAPQVAHALLRAHAALTQHYMVWRTTPAPPGEGTAARDAQQRWDAARTILRDTVHALADSGPRTLGLDEESPLAQQQRDAFVDLPEPRLYASAPPHAIANWHAWQRSLGVPVELATPRRARAGAALEDARAVRAAARRLAVAVDAYEDSQDVSGARSLWRLALDMYADCYHGCLDTHDARNVCRAAMACVGAAADAQRAAAAPDSHVLASAMGTGGQFLKDALEQGGGAKRRMEFDHERQACVAESLTCVAAGGVAAVDREQLAAIARHYEVVTAIIAAAPSLRAAPAATATPGPIP